MHRYFLILSLSSALTTPVFGGFAKEVLDEQLAVAKVNVGRLKVFYNQATPTNPEAKAAKNQILEDYNEVFRQLHSDKNPDNDRVESILRNEQLLKTYGIDPDSTPGRTPAALPKRPEPFFRQDRAASLALPTTPGLSAKVKNPFETFIDSQSASKDAKALGDIALLCAQAYRHEAQVLPSGKNTEYYKALAGLYEEYSENCSGKIVDTTSIVDTALKIREAESLLSQLDDFKGISLSRELPVAQAYPLPMTRTMAKRPAEEPAEVDAATAGAAAAGPADGKIRWDTIPENERNVALLAYDAHLGARNLVNAVGERLQNPAFHVEAVMSPEEIDQWFAKQDETLGKALEALDNPARLNQGLAEHRERLRGLRNHFVRDFAPVAGEANAAVRALKDFVKENPPPNCGENPYAGELLVRYQTISGSLRTSLEPALTRLALVPSQYLGYQNPWDLRLEIFPDLWDPRGKETGAGAAATPQAALFWNNVPKDITKRVEAFQRSIGDKIDQYNGQKGTPEESIMTLGGDAYNFLVPLGLFSRQLKEFSFASRGKEMTHGDQPLKTKEELKAYLSKLRKDLPTLPCPTDEILNTVFHHLETNFDALHRAQNLKIPTQELLKVWSSVRDYVELVKDEVMEDPTGPVADNLRFFLGEAKRLMHEQNTQCGAGALGRSILLYGTIFTFLQNLPAKK